MPSGLRDELVEHFNAVLRNHLEGKWEVAELRGAKFCEVVYTIIRGMADGSYPERASKPSNFLKACRDLESETSLPRALRIQIPRTLPAIYEIRNNRNVGHVGGEVDPSHMDSAFVRAACQWMMADLVRAFHGLTVQEATAVTEALIEREMPLVWVKGDARRVLDPDMATADRVLLLLHSATGPVAAEVLRDWAEYENASRFKSRILKGLHQKKLVEYDRAGLKVEILPPGVVHVEQEILKGRGL